MPSHPSKQQSYKFSALSVLSVDKKWIADAVLLKRFVLFAVMGEGSRLHAGEPSALHIASD